MDPAPVFKIIIAYETFATGLRAKEVTERLNSQLKPEFEVKCDVWKFELLGHAQLRALAASEAVDADLIILSCHAGGDLAPNVSKWVEAWLPRKRENPAALVVLIDQDREFEEPSPLLSYLRDAASRGGLDFFCKTGNWRRHQDFEFTFETTPRYAETTAPALVAPLADILCEDALPRALSMHN
jgi:hypothetical protein